ncbi:hypothetical protein GCM10009601_04290 [Streptomyces thermospinosisporus]|uniref:Uncharacterized protein n=2 Tax=Streptomyces thermospinosisporus TaxID=161482 RepID=A0ABN1YJ15_9ACTN
MPARPGVLLNGSLILLNGARSGSAGVLVVEPWSWLWPSELMEPARAVIPRQARAAMTTTAANELRRCRQRPLEFLATNATYEHEQADGGNPGAALGELLEMLDAAADQADTEGQRQGEREAVDDLRLGVEAELSEADRHRFDAVTAGLTTDWNSARPKKR